MSCTHYSVLKLRLCFGNDFFKTLFITEICFKDHFTGQFCNFVYSCIKRLCLNVKKYPHVRIIFHISSYADICKYTSGIFINGICQTGIGIIFSIHKTDHYIEKTCVRQKILRNSCTIKSQGKICYPVCKNIFFYVFYTFNFRLLIFYQYGLPVYIIQ